ncbi:MAG: hypothetical protein U1F57_04175 [bacterium]
MLPKETLSELLFFLVENEELKSIERLGSFTPTLVKESLKELAVQLRQEADKEQDYTKIDYKHFEELSPHVKQVLSTLTPREFQTLFKNFGFENS